MNTRRFGRGGFEYYVALDGSRISLGAQEDATYILGTVGAGIFGTFALFYNSALFGVAFGGILSATVAYSLQSRAWKRTAKRDFAMENAEAIYSPLYKELGAVFATAKGFNHHMGYGALATEDWNRISSEPYYEFIPIDVRKELDDLYRIIERFNNAVVESQQSVQKLVLKNASKFYGTPITSMYMGGKAENLGYSGFDLLKPLLFGIHPRMILSQSYPDREDLKLTVLVERRSANGTIEAVTLEGPSERDNFDKFYKELSEEVENLKPVKDLKSALASIVRSSPQVRDSVLLEIKKSRAI